MGKRLFRYTADLSVIESLRSAQTMLHWVLKSGKVILARVVEANTGGKLKLQGPEGNMSEINRADIEEIIEDRRSDY